MLSSPKKNRTIILSETKFEFSVEDSVALPISSAALSALMSTPNLCNKCQDVVDLLAKLDRREHGGYRWTQFYQNSSQVISSSESGCLLCSQILRLIEIRFPSEPVTFDYINVHVNKTDDRIQLSLKVKEEKELFRHIEIEAYRENGQWTTFSVQHAYHAVKHKI